MSVVRVMNVLIVDDSPFACKAIARMLRDDPALNVVGQAHDGHEALRLLEEYATYQEVIKLLQSHRKLQGDILKDLRDSKKGK